MARDYEALKQWFASQPAAKQELETTFEVIGKILGDEKLPPSAYQYPTWWLDKSANTTHTHARAWLQTGWQVDQLDLRAKTVSFKRV